MSVDEDIEKLNAEAQKAKSDAGNLEQLKSLYPNIKKWTGRWNKVAYYTKLVNHLVDQVDFRFNCGCCNDSPFEAWPYVNTEFGKVYSDPPQFWIGEKNVLYGEEEYPDEPYVKADYGWDAKFTNAGLSEKVIELVRERLRADVF